MAMNPTSPGRCPYCGGGNIISGIRTGMTAEAGSIGLEYKTRFLLGGTEGLLADLCRDCGSVIRFFIRNTDRNWVVE